MAIDHAEHIEQTDHTDHVKYAEHDDQVEHTDPARHTDHVELTAPVKREDGVEPNGHALQDAPSEIVSTPVVAALPPVQNNKWDAPPSTDTVTSFIQASFIRVRSKDHCIHNNGE